jgi:hypothetical protein
MASPYSLGEGILVKFKDGSHKYLGKITSGVRRNEMVSLVRTDDLEALESAAGIAPKITEPIGKHEARFPDKLFINPEDKSEHGFFFDGYKYYMDNNIWVRYHHAEKSVGILRRVSQYSIGDGVIILSKDRFHDFKGEIWGDVREYGRLSLIRARDLDALERAVVSVAPKLIGPIGKHEDFPDKWPSDKNKKPEHGFLFDGFKYCTKDSIWVRYHPVVA